MYNFQFGFVSVTCQQLAILETMPVITAYGFRTQTSQIVIQHLWPINIHMSHRAHKSKVSL